ncbi:hypothetical protein QAD02_014450 [Eretmocerus hayati]|uniref:Uncharacterized protein n=1 Tax=Eretmocerus hayati TaxID=131215 RepID=A0ACC2P6D5_9HYME|nr:hypothetical protein QAD02_014450 [Eretmocerus hayati]
MNKNPASLPSSNGVLRNILPPIVIQPQGGFKLALTDISNLAITVVSATNTESNIESLFNTNGISASPPAIVGYGLTNVMNNVEEELSSSVVKPSLFSSEPALLENFDFGIPKEYTADQPDCEYC